ncbi:MAG: NAD-dependent epimerase/dehydratase family protein [Rhodobacteraceae bacterium]|jgi:UDP-glucuronate 4-epimerase|nr:NAD-dependent epimerase/dehydratase family protein [Paracoccaceae bacterium]
MPVDRRALVTGSAGFIGYHLCERLLAAGWQVTGLDGMTPYYDPGLKRDRHSRLARHAGFRAVVGMVEAPGLAAGLLAETRPALVVHLAAQAGVRHSLEAPESYVAANLAGTFALLEAARATPPAHLMLASTSSVYGASTTLPYAETDRADWPLSFYAATKKATEAMAHSYAHLFAIPVTAFRFFTVYGPWGRPDMALFRFTRAILAGEPIEVYGHGAMRRDFTYVGDLVEGIMRLIAVVPPPPGPSRPPLVDCDSLSPAAPWRVVNLGNGAPVELVDFIAAVEAAAGRRAERRLMPMQPGDVPATWASTALADALIGPLPRTPLAEGVAAFVAWYRDRHGI